MNEDREGNRLARLHTDKLGKIFKCKTTATMIKEQLIKHKFLKSLGDHKIGEKSTSYDIGERLDSATWKMSEDVYDCAFLTYAGEINGLSIDYEQCLPLIAHYNENKFNAFNWTLKHFSGNYNISPECGRMFGAFNMINSTLRREIKIRGESVDEIDFKGSHYYYLSILSKERPITYEEYMEHFGVERETAKRNLLLWLGGNSKDIDRDSINRWVKGLGLVKTASLVENLYRAHYSRLVIKLMRMESEIMVGIAKEFDIPSIHDGLLTPKSKTKEIVRSLLAKCLAKHGKTPTITINGEIYGESIYE
jgi:hypothetical protein